MFIQSLGQEYPLEKGMATHSSILAWRIPWMGESGGLQSIGSQRVGQNWSDLAQHSTYHTTLLHTRQTDYWTLRKRCSPWFSLVTQMVKHLPTVQEAWVQSLGQEDPLEKWMATHSSILAWRIHGHRSLADCNPWGCKELDKIERLTLFHFHTYFNELFW